MRLPHNAIGEWWHQPGLDRLDAIEAALHSPQVAVKGVHINNESRASRGLSAVEPEGLAKAITWEVRSARRGGTFL